MPLRGLAKSAWLGAGVVAIVGLGTPARAADSAKPEPVAKVLADIEAQQAKLPRDLIDPSVVVSEAAGDPAKLLAWVRENTRLVSYDGSLRGPLGVLMDRTGNALDRSLLLARLLELSGFEARIVTAKLPPADFAKIVAENTKPAPTPAAENPDDAKDRKAFADQAASISSMILAKTGPLTPAAVEANPTHYWVQYNDGKSWADLDATIAGTPGQSRAKADGSPIPLDPSTHTLPKDANLTQTAKLWLIVERWEDGKLIDSPLLTYTFDASTTPLAAATLTFTPVDAKQSKAVQRNFTTGAQLRDKLLTETAWTPVIADGKSGGRMARMFNEAGVVGDLPKSFDGAAEIGNMNRGAFGGMTGGITGSSDKPAEAPTVLTALIADYQLTTPGKPTRHVKRFIFDSVGPEARRLTQPIPKPKWTDQQRLDRGAELAALNDTLVAFAGLPTDAYIYRFAQRAIDSKDAAIKADKGRVDDSTLDKVANGRSLRTLELFAASRESDFNPGLAIAEPQVYRRIIRYEPDAKARDLHVTVFSDLAWNCVTAIAPSPQSTAAIVNQGVMDTLEEAVVVLRNTPPAAADTSAAMLAEATKQGVEIVAIRDAKDSHLAAFAGATKARMLQDLDAGQILVAPAKPLTIDGQPRTGWWRVDPTSAQVVGVMDTGLLQNTIEYAETTEINGIRLTRFYKMDVGPAAREWATHMMRQRSMTSWNQWINLLRYAQEAINTGGLLPPW